MVAEKQTNNTNIQTYIHTLFGKQFQETRRVPTANQASFRHGPGLKRSLLTEKITNFS